MDLGARRRHWPSSTRRNCYQLNPAFKRRITMDGPKHLLVPISNAQILATNLQEMPEQELVDWHEYKVRPGDSLYTIARRHNLTVGMLQEINRLPGNHLRIGQLLSIPSQSGQPAPVAARTVASQTSASGSSYNYRVRNGDSLWTIARAHKVSVNDLQRWNKLPANSLKIDQVLTLHGGSGKNAEQGMQTATLYKVREGDSLYAIAKRFNVNLAHLQSWNPEQQCAPATRPDADPVPGQLTSAATPKRYPMRRGGTAFSSRDKLLLYRLPFRRHGPGPLT